MGKSKILIAGAGVAGPALALCLARYGFEPTVVELASGLRSGGSAVDFRGATHLAVLDRMGLVGPLRAVQTGGTAFRFVDERGCTLMELPADFAGGDIEVRRFDLSRLLHEHGDTGIEYRFGDGIAALEETSTGVNVTFASGERRTFDVVIGADGVHSTVRRLAFGPEREFVRHLGYYVATWGVPSQPSGDRATLLYNAPGRVAGVGGGDREGSGASTFFAFASPQLSYDRRDPDQARRIVAERFRDMGWEVPRLLEDLRTAPDVYFDAICRVDVSSWSRGRIALVGDAACGATLGGMGTGTALVGAYVLAGELAAANGDHAIAFPRYEGLLHAYAQRCQEGGESAGRFLAPPSRGAASVRNALFRRKWIMGMMLRMTERRASDIDLPDYRMPGPMEAPTAAIAAGN